jgi:hypothetical protein
LAHILFDLETELIPEPLDLNRQIPGITVGATLTDKGDLQLWFEKDEDGRATGSTLGRATARNLVGYLLETTQAGNALITWNGAGFDFRVLAQASGMMTECVDLAWAHLDMMFWLHCTKGFSVGLAKAAQAVGSGKAEGLTGADASKLWAAGQYERVMRYVAQDVRVLAAVYQTAARDSRLKWVTGRGRVASAQGVPLCVRDAYALPLPDTSWMDAPWPREKFVRWMLEQG